MTRNDAIRAAAAFIAIVVTVAASAWMAVVVIKPGYDNPRSRMYTSKLGRGALQRRADKPFEVSVCSLKPHVLTGKFVGEGMLQTEPVQVPIIAMSRILKVNAEEGQRVHKGDVLVELDSSRVEIKVKACLAALAIAESEYERTRIGSAYVLDMERPVRDTIRLEGIQREGALLDELHAMYVSLASDRTITRAELIEHQLRIEEHRTDLEEHELNLKRAELGKVHSLEVAKAAIREAELAIDHRKNELRDYKVICPVEGIVERRFVHPGEYNQDPGRPAFLVTTGLWFEANFDQTTWGQFRVGDTAELRLETHPGRLFRARVAKIHPFVTYSLGGPEVNRPIRPLGSGAPEWPSTYAVRIELIDEPEGLVPGMTGFASVVTERQAMVVPRSAVRSMSAGRGLICLANGSEVRPVEVRTGWKDTQWTEIVEGLDPNELVIFKGHETLLEGDAIQIVEHLAPADDDRATTLAMTTEGIQ